MTSHCRGDLSPIDAESEAVDGLPKLTGQVAECHRSFGRIRAAVSG
jgi:hypothetical protein